jgi:hypothetical protein
MKKQKINLNAVHKPHVISSNQSVVFTVMALKITAGGERYFQYFVFIPAISEKNYTFAQSFAVP